VETVDACVVMVIRF